MREPLQGLLNNLFKDDRVLCDRGQYLFSTNPALQRTDANESQFELCSDRLQRLYPTYSVTEQGVFQPRPEAMMISFPEIKRLLLSKDPADYDRLQELTVGKCSLLDG